MRERQDLDYGAKPRMKAATVRKRDKSSDTTELIVSTDSAQTGSEPVVVYTPPARKPLADITGFDIPRGVDRDELVLEFEPSND